MEEVERRWERPSSVSLSGEANTALPRERMDARSGDWNSYSVLNTFSAASSVVARSASVCALETNPASYADGAR